MCLPLCVSQLLNLVLQKSIITETQQFVEMNEAFMKEKWLKKASFIENSTDEAINESISANPEIIEIVNSQFLPTTSSTATTSMTLDRTSLSANIPCSSRPIGSTNSTTSSGISSDTCSFLLSAKNLKRNLNLILQMLMLEPPRH